MLFLVLQLKDLVSGKIKGDNVRIISGDVLTGD
jgi:Na+-transporting NADH:ubiquinone oxidoreductase subunit NqrA